MDGNKTRTWSDLPADIASAIAGRLTDRADLSRFRSVCPSWRSGSAAHAARRRVPFLLLPTESYGGAAAGRRAWSLAGDRLRNIPVPEAAGRSFLFASGHGWMLAVAERDLSAALVYPFAGGDLRLPALPASSFGDGGEEKDKLIRDLSWDWSPHGVVVSTRVSGACLWDDEGKGAFFSRPGDESWTPVGSPSACVTGVTYCGGAFYLLEGSTCKVTAVDAETLVVAAVIAPPELGIPSWGREANLAAGPPGGEILLAVRTALLHSGVVTNKVVKVFRASRAAGGDRSLSWSEVAGGIGGGRAVFVDHLRAICVDATALAGVRGNCLYVAGGHEEVNDDYGMDVSGRYTVEVLDVAELRTVDLSFGSLASVRLSSFRQWPTWSLPSLHC
ncbi:hypothetical protein ACP4OV_028830 [Aristida adscensionis]